MMDLFAQDGGPLFTTGSDAEELVVRPTELLDGAAPSASAVAAGALLRLGALTGDDRLTSAGEALLATLPPVPPPIPGRRPGRGRLPAGRRRHHRGGGGRRPARLVDGVRRRFEPDGRLGLGRAHRLAAVGRAPSTDSPSLPPAYACREPVGTARDLAAHLDAELAAERSAMATPGTTVATWPGHPNDGGGSGRRRAATGPVGAPTRPQEVSGPESGDPPLHGARLWNRRHHRGRSHDRCRRPTAHRLDR